MEHLIYYTSNFSMDKPELEIPDEIVATYLDILIYQAEIERLKEGIEMSEDVETRKEIRETLRDYKNHLKAHQARLKRLQHE